MLARQKHYLSSWSALRQTLIGGALESGDASVVTIMGCG